ncbi:MAG: hypothetical protein NTW97_05795 [Candidatus Krumholzibacteria bacterium]|nr:hypothetical protein [Candidatus Krumholzibacteria bacterium]
MKTGLSIIVLAAALSLGRGSSNAPASPAFAKVPADSLVAHIDRYRDTGVEVEGLVVHLCGVDGRKMKLMTAGGAIVKIVPRDSSGGFDESFYKKMVRVRGIAKESRIESSYVDRMESEKALLCHIDNTPCKDSTWVSGQRESGAADSLSKRDIGRLRSTMARTGKSYVSVVTVVAERVEIVGEPPKK